MHCRTKRVAVGLEVVFSAQRAFCRVRVMGSNPNFNRMASALD